MESDWITFSRRELHTPLVIAALLVTFVLWRKEWSGLIGLPLIYLSWCSSVPNLNLIAGCLPFLATLVISLVGWGFGSQGLVVAGGACGLTWIIASLETTGHCCPVEKDAVSTVQEENITNE